MVTGCSARCWRSVNGDRAPVCGPTTNGGMPRKKKSPARDPGLSVEQSPAARAPAPGAAGLNIERGGAGAGVSWSWSGCPSTVADQAAAMARNESKNSDNVGAEKSTNARFSGKEEIVNKMQEMFSHLDPEVIYLVLNECDFRVEHAMDSLLELSVAAEGTAPGPTAVSGFDSVASLLYANPQQGECTVATTRADRPQALAGEKEEDEDPDATGNRLTAEFDTLIDREMESLSAQPPPFTGTFPPLPEEPAPRQALPELLQSSVERDRWAGLGQPVETDGVSGGGSGSRSPLNALSFSGPTLCLPQPALLDFSHLAGESGSRKPALDLGSCSRPSAFQAYKKSPGTRGTSGCQVTAGGCGEAALPEPGSGSALGQSAEGKEPLANPSLFWNMQAPEFQPRSPGPAFITPVVSNPTPWKSQPMHYWLNHEPALQAPLKPAATIPKSWTLPGVPRPPAPLRTARLQGKVLVLLRGPPGSGKSTLARSILSQNPRGVALSTDEFFDRDGQYCYNATQLGEAHEWNHCRAKEAFRMNMSPIIIDNTNMQIWEMKPYVALAKQHNYKVMFREPDTWWKFKPRELERRTKHGVTKERIRRMIDRYERHASVDAVMCSVYQRPEVGNRGRVPLTLPLPETRVLQPSLSEVKPDLVEEPHLSLGPAQGYGHAQLFSSLPDVSSMGRGSAREESLGAGSSSGSSNSSLKGSSISRPVRVGVAEPLDNSVLDWEQRAHPLPECGSRAWDRERAPEISWQTQNRADDHPVAFSESIGQRVRRDRARTRQLKAGAVDGAGQSGSSDALGGNGSRCEEAGAGQAVGCDRVRPELLDFVGDWPLEVMEQREQRLRPGSGKGTQQDGRGSAEQGRNPGAKMEEGAEQNETFSEFQKLLDLLQMDVGSSRKQTFPSAGSPIDFMLSCSSEDLSKDDESGHQGTRSPTPSCGEGFDQRAGRNTRPELLDCIADWTLSDITPIRETPQSLAEAPPPPAQTGIRTPDRGTEQHNSGLEEWESSPMCSRDIEPTEQKAEPPGGAVGSPVSGGSQERRLRQTRRAGKQCKLALTFTSPTPPRTPDSPVAPPYPVAITPETPASCHASCSVQTDPREFALLWRLDRQWQGDPAIDHPDVRVLSVDGVHFQPSLSGVLEPPAQQEVPYRTMHDKGTQVDEQELTIGDGNKAQDLQILSCHFKLVSYETLEDLYDKCHQDIQWTTNLLLDSGEELFRDDDDPQSEQEQAGKEHPAQGSRLDHQADLPKVCVERETPIALDAEYLKVLPDSEHQSMGADVGFEEETHPVPEEGPGPEDPAVIAEHRGGAEEEKPVIGPSSLGELSASRPNEEPDTPTQLLTSREEETPVGTLEGASEAQDDLPQGLDQDCPVSAEVPQEDGGVAFLLEEEEDEEEAAAASDLPSSDQVSWSLVSQLQEMRRRDKEGERNEKEGEREREKEREKEKAAQAKQDRLCLDIQSLELKLPAELAFQLSELFGPVGVAPGTLSPEDCSVQIDLNLARLLHQKWKETIQERQRQEVLSYHLLQESSDHWGESHPPMGDPADATWAPHFLLGTDGLASLSQSEAGVESVPFMDHWSTPQSHVSLRDIMLEEQALQESMEKCRESRAEGKDGAALMKERQLYATFPSIDRHFLSDIFKDHNYSLEQTTQFLSSLLGEEPVRTVVAPEMAPPKDAQRPKSKDRWRKGKEAGPTTGEFQDMQAPDYEDFRTEATLQRRRQQECFSKAAEAYRQGMKDVASFYAQQGRLHGQKMREANGRAATQIFERVNSTLLPENVLDLHGLHVDEALHHLRRVLEEKTAEWQQGGCRAQLSIITGRGNHSQGGVARIRPAVIDYLSCNEYTFTEPKCGLVLVTLR